MNRLVFVFLLNDEVCSLNALHSLYSILLCCTLALPVWGEDTYTMRGFDTRIQQGIDLIYNLRFAEAERHFQAIIAAEPDNPLGYFFRAMVSWWRILIDLPDETHDAEFHTRLKQCIEVCDRRLKKDPMDFDAILFKGGAIGFRGRLYGDRERYLKAARDGLRGLPLLKKSRQLEPTNKDILFGQGLYHYFAEVMPKRHRILRPLMAFLPDGDRVLGLQQLKEVAREGAYARTEAAYFLGQIYRIFEKDNRRALPYFEGTLQAVPRQRPLPPLHRTAYDRTRPLALGCALVRRIRAAQLGWSDRLPPPRPLGGALLLGQIRLFRAALCPKPPTI